MSYETMYQNLQGQLDIADEKLGWRGTGIGRIHRIEQLLKIEALTQELVEAAELALDQGDFKNGVTDSTGTIDEGDVKVAGRLSDAVRAVREVMQPTSYLMEIFNLPERASTDDQRWQEGHADGENNVDPRPGFCHVYRSGWCHGFCEREQCFPTRAAKEYLKRARPA